jgi:hypothetical protein
MIGFLAITDKRLGSPVACEPALHVSTVNHSHILYVPKVIENVKAKKNEKCCNELHRDTLT